VNPAQRKTRSGSRTRTLLKTAVTVALCALIIWKGDWRTIWHILRQADPWMLGAVFAGMLLGVSISAFKWRLILSVHGLRFGFNRLQAYYFTSVFFNNFLPSNIGGDVYRIYQTARGQASRAPAVVAVLTERLTGIWALVALAAAGGAVIYVRGPFQPRWLLPCILAFSAIALAPLVFLAVSQRAHSWLMAAGWFPGRLKSVLALSEDYRRHPGKSLQIIAISFGFHLFTLSWMLLLSYAAGDPSSLTRLVMGAAISNLAALIPVSLNGIGLFDGSFIYVMGDLGMSFDAALMMMLVIRALLVPLSLIGGLFYLKDKKTVDMQKLRTDTDETGEAASG